MVDFSVMNKSELRKFARAHQVDVHGMNEDGARSALIAWQGAQEPVVVQDEQGPVTIEVVQEPVPAETVTEQPEVLVLEDGPPVVVPSVIGPVPTPTIDAILDQPAIEPVLEQPVPVPAVVVPVPLPVSKPARLEAHGVKQPAVGTICRQIWDYCDAVRATNVQPKAKELRAWGAGRLDDVTMTIQFYRWRKFRGISGRQA